MKIYIGQSFPWLPTFMAHVVVQRVKLPPKDLEVRLVFVFVQWIDEQFGFGPYAIDNLDGGGILLSFVINNSTSLSRTWAAAIFPDLYDPVKYNNGGYSMTKAMKADWSVLETGAAGYIEKED